MKKLLISATLLIGMTASAMVFSSFEPTKKSESISYAEGIWDKIGRYRGVARIHLNNGGAEYVDAYFTIWASNRNRAETMRWVFDGGGKNEYATHDGKNPSETRSATGYLKYTKVGAANRYYCEYEGQWYYLENFDY